jgi:CrcB protein
MNFFYVFLGAGAGGALRHAVNMATMRFGWTSFPVGTLTVNILGSFAMGALTALFAQRSDVPQAVRLLLTTGLLGGFTTFSTFSLDFAVIWERGNIATALAYGATSIGCSIGGLFLALWLFRSVVKV